MEFVLLLMELQSIKLHKLLSYSDVPKNLIQVMGIVQNEMMSQNISEHYVITCLPVSAETLELK